VICIDTTGIFGTIALLLVFELCWLIRMRQRKWKLEASTGWVMLIFYLVWFIASIAKDSA
jgi:Ca2+/Na+ antiporter